MVRFTLSRELSYWFGTPAKFYARHHQLMKMGEPTEPAHFPFLD